MPENNKESRISAHILVADDDPMIQEVLRTKLERSDYRVTIVAEGQAALAALAGELPDLLVLDIKMPGIDGYEICRRLRALEATRAMPILMLTAYGGVDHVIKGLDAGADDYVSKPFHIEEVLRRIRSLLRMRQIERELRQKEAHLARVETLGQLLVTLAHHINNSLAIITGRAQALNGDDLDKARRLKEACLKQSRRIQAVLQSLEDLAGQMKISTTDYAGSQLKMFDIEGEIARRLQIEDEDP